MGTHFALTFQLPAYRRQHAAGRKTKTLSKIKAGSIGMVLLILLAGSMLFYLVQVNNFSTQGYAINHLQSQIRELQDQHDKLQVQAAQLQSIDRIQSDPGVVNMVPVTHLTYVQAPTLSQR